MNILQFRRPRSNEVPVLVAIKPGPPGGMAIIEQDGAHTYDLPLLPQEHQKVIDTTNLRLLLLRALRRRPARAYVEHEYPRAHLKLTHSKSLALIAVVSTLRDLGIPFELAPRAKWRAALGPVARGAAERARDRAEALLVAEYGLQVQLATASRLQEAQP